MSPKLGRARCLVCVLVLGKLAIGVSGCVSETAGYPEAKHLIQERTGHDAEWRAHDSARASIKRTRELLSQPLTVDGAVELALWNNSELQASFEEIGVARAEVVKALRLPNPSVEATVRFHVRHGGAPEPGFRALISLSTLLFTPLRSGAARAELHAAIASVGGAALDLAHDARVGFYRYQAAEQILELHRTVLKAARASLEAARQLHAAGNIRELDLANEQALYEEARLELARAEADALEAREGLAATLGLWGRAAAFRVQGRLAEPPRDEQAASELERQSLAKSIDLLIVKHRFTAAARRANLARWSGWVPELSAGVEAERDDDGWEIGPLAALELPLFYQGQGEVALARAEMRREYQRHRALATGIRAASRSALARLRESRDRALHVKNVLMPVRARILNESQLAYNAMQIGIFQLLLAKREQIRTARQYVEALRDYWLAKASVEQLLAGRMVPRERSPERSAPMPMPMPNSDSH